MSFLAAWMVKVVTILLFLLHCHHSLLALPLAALAEEGYEADTSSAKDMIAFFMLSDEHRQSGLPQKSSPAPQSSQEEFELNHIVSEFCHRTGYIVRVLLPVSAYKQSVDWQSTPLLQSDWDILTPPPREV